jgi:hypothetical protein
LSTRVFTNPKVLHWAALFYFSSHIIEHFLIEAEIVIGYLDFLYLMNSLDESNDIYMETVIRYVS